MCYVRLNFPDKILAEIEDETKIDEFCWITGEFFIWSRINIMTKPKSYNYHSCKYLHQLDSKLNQQFLIFFVFRFCLLCASSKWNNLNQMGFDILSNIASEMALEDTSTDTCVNEVLLSTLTTCISSVDRFQVKLFS